MPKCYHCAEDLPQLFHCNECGKDYCTFHQDPIIHNCNIVKEESSHNPYQSSQPSYTNVSTVTPSNTYGQSPQYPTQTSSGPSRGTTDGAYTWYRQERALPENAFTPESGIDFKGILFPYKSEFIHLLFGCILIYLIGLFSFYNPANQEVLEQFGMGWAIFMLAGFYMTAFLFHEFGHRQVALHYGFQTKFRLLTIGMALTAFSVVMGLYKLLDPSGFSFPSLALPGAVVVLGLDKVSKETGTCKAAGPLVNLVYGIILLIISFVIPKSLFPLNYLIGVAASLNFMLGMFNMLPIGILDGQNILKWSKIVYVTLAVSLLILLIINYIIIYEPNMIEMIYGSF